MSSALKTVKIKQYQWKNLPQSCTMIVIGAPDTGKSNFVEHMCYMLKHRYPVARVWCGTEDTQGRFKKFIPEMFITSDYIDKEHEKKIIRQKQCMLNKCQNPYCIAIMDDCGDDPKNFKSKLMVGQIKNGRHWDELYVIANQYIFDLPPAVRKSIAVVVLFKEDSPTERKKLYDTFSPSCTYAEFNDLMDQLTGDYTCMIINRRSQSKKLEDCVFYYKAPNMDKKQWKFGCKELWEWNKQRFNPKYTPKFM